MDLISRGYEQAHQLKKTIAVVGLVATTLFSGSAFAERFAVIMKDRETFRQTHQQIQKGIQLQAVQLKSVRGLTSPFQKVGVHVEQSLGHLNSLVVQAETAEQLQALRATGLVESIEKEVFYPAPKPILGFMPTRAWTFNLQSAAAVVNPLDLPAPGVPWGIGAVHAPQAWGPAHKGATARVLVLDTGIDRDHPALKNNFEEGRDFTGEEASPYEYADVIGHGTHCAGTIAAVQLEEGFVGVAPEAKILAGRVCGHQGCSNIAVAAGMNWAIEKNVDVVSMSLGGPFATPVEMRAAKALNEAGITVVAASGNEAKQGVSYPAAFETSIAVGAVDHNLEKAKFSNWGPELDVVAPGVDVVSSVPMGSGRESKALVNGNRVKSTSFSGSPEISEAISNQLVFSGLGKPGDFPEAVQGKFALISRGEISFADKVTAAIQAGAAGVVIFNNEAGLMNGALTTDGSTVAIPVVMIEQNMGVQIKAALEIGSKVEFSMQTLATNYASFAGTSMATPHVAGVVALMKAANHSLTPAQVLSILKETATALGPNSNNEFGSGLVNAERAVQAALAVVQAPASVRRIH